MTVINRMINVSMHYKKILTIFLTVFFIYFIFFVPVSADTEYDWNVKCFESSNEDLQTQLDVSSIGHSYYPNADWCIIGKTDALFGLGRYQEALDEINNELIVHPDMGYLYWAKALTLKQLGQYQESYNALNNALKYAPNDPLMLNLKKELSQNYNVVTTPSASPSYSSQTASSSTSGNSAIKNPSSGNSFDSSIVLMVVFIVGACVILGFFILRKQPVSPSNETTITTLSQQYIPSHYNQSPPIPDPLLSIQPYIDRLVQSQPKPLESLEKFYAFLYLEGFNLTPELKNAIEKRIRETRDDQERTQKKQQISAELFGGSSGNAPAATSTSQVIPLSTVPADSTCQVCLSEFSSAEPGAVKCPHCGNLFHYRCIAKWVNKNGTCPVCKKDLKA